jgi:hypothetical protein
MDYIQAKTQNQNYYDEEQRLMAELNYQVNKAAQSSVG